MISCEEGQFGKIWDSDNEQSLKGYKGVDLDIHYRLRAKDNAFCISNEPCVLLMWDFEKTSVSNLREVHAIDVSEDGCQ